MRNGSDVWANRSRLMHKTHDAIFIDAKIGSSNQMLCQCVHAADFICM